jgi:hypothetical protein
LDITLFTLLSPEEFKYFPVQRYRIAAFRFPRFFRLVRFMAIVFRRNKKEHWWNNAEMIKLNEVAE